MGSPRLASPTIIRNELGQHSQSPPPLSDSDPGKKLQFVLAHAKPRVLTAPVAPPVQPPVHLATPELVLNRLVPWAEDDQKPR